MKPYRLVIYKNALSAKTESARHWAREASIGFTTLAEAIEWGDAAINDKIYNTTGKKFYVITKPEDETQVLYGTMLYQ